MKKSYLLLRLTLLMGLLGGGLTRPLAWAQVTPDISTTLSATPTSLNATASVTLTVGVTNTGSGAVTATNVTRTVTGLPTGLSGVTFGGTGNANATYNSGAGSVTFTGGPYSLAASGASLNYTITFTVPCGTASFTATSTVGCTGDTNTGNNTATAGVTVNNTAAPAQPGAITGSAVPCRNTAGNVYSISAVSSATTYTWVVPTGWNVTLGAGTTSITVTTPNNNTTGNITVTAGNACGTSAVRTLSVTPQTATSQPSTITPGGSLCVGSTRTFSVTNTANVTYTWAIPGWTIISGQGTNSISATVAGPAGTAVTVTVTPSNACGNGPARTLSQTPVAVPAQPTITGTQTPCTGSVVTYTATAGATTYAWSLPTGYTGASTTNTINVTVAAGAGNGTISVTATTGGCTSPAGTLALTPTATPAQPAVISGSTTPCQNSTGNTYSVASVPVGETYTWSYSGTGATFPGGNTGASVNVSFAAGATNGNLIITPTVGTAPVCSGTTRTLALTPLGAPAQPSVITGAAAPCVSSSRGYSVTNVAGLTYTWVVPAAVGTISSGQGTNSITVDMAATTGTGSISVTATYAGCTTASTARTLNVTSVASLPASAAISGAAAPCVGTTGVVYTATAVAGAVSYQWSVTGTGWSITANATTAAPTFTVGSGPGTLTVAAVNDCGPGTTQTRIITPASGIPAQPGAISGPGVVYINRTGNTYTIAAVPEAVSYTWTVPAAIGTITAGQGTASITVTAAGATSTGNSISVVAINSCGTGTAQTLPVNVQDAVDVVTTVSAPAFADAGASVYFTITYTNIGSQNATGVVTNLAMSNSSGSVLTGISLSQSGVFTPTAADGGITGIAAYGDDSNPSITLNAGATTTRTFLVTVPASGTLTGIASSTQTTTDANAANNNGTAPGATAIVTVRQSADVITVVAGPQYVAPGRQVTYSVTPTNQGPSVASNVVTTLTGLPTGLTGVSVFAGGTYNSGTGTVTWPATASIARGASLPLGVRFTAGASGTITVTASSTSATPDPSTANNDGTGAQANLTTVITGAVSNTECSNPGIDGDLTTTAASVLNTYFPGTGTVSAGGTTVTVGPVTTGYGSAPIAVGDLVLLIQMQGADIDATNSDAYGSGVTGQLRANGAIRNVDYSAGLYEYRIAASAVPTTGGTITLTRPTSFGYTTAAATSSTGRRVYQVIRVPQYQTLTLGATLTAPRWDGTTGGVLAVDVAGATYFNGQTINLTGIGFRGAGGRQLGGAAGVINTDYRHSASIATSAGKGEGIAGTPRYLNNAGVLLDQGFDGYPNGDYARGAPGNAGGGGTDGRPGANDQNSGGGGGSNAGYGGRGGNSWSTNLEDGGFGGGDFTEANPTRLILGGGGGAGTTNNGTGTPGAGFASSGAAGGGMLIMRTGSVNGTGTMNVSGADMTYVAGNDASGGGGGGGSVVLVANPGVSLSNLTILARGGNGGSNTGGGVPHGPGGGGSGGVVFTSNTLNAATSLQPGATGSTSSSNIYGAGTGTAASGNILTNLVVADLPNIISGAACSADVVVTASGPAVAVAGASVIYTVSVTNLGLNTANGVVPTLTLPAGVTITATPFGSTVSGNVVTLPAIGSIAVGAAATNYNVTFTMPAANVTGTAAATSASNDPVDGNSDGTAANANVTTRFNPAPVANPATFADVNPGGTNNYSLPNTAFSGTDDVSVASIRLTAFPTNATSITVNGTTYTSGTFPGAGITLPATAAGNLAAGNTILIDPINNVLGTNLPVVLPYVLIDNDGGPSNSANITINFSDLTISGTLFHDLNGLTNNLIDGTAIGRTLTSNIQLYANLLNAAGTAVVASVTLPITGGTTGQYSFGTAVGLQQNTSYTVVLASANNSIVPVLPAGWVSTAEGTATGDGTPDGSLTTALTTTAVSGANYGIEQRPTAGANTTAGPIVNPGGTQTYAVTSTLFTGTDVNTGAVTGLYFATFPANATSITLDGNFYTSATFPAAGVTVPANASGNPTTQIRIDPVNNTAGNFTVVLSYQAVDNANVRSSNSATVTVTFSDITISGNVYNDGNGGAVTTTVPIGSASANQLYVNLVDGTGTVVGTSTVNTTTGAYSLGTANGTQTNTTFTTVLSTVQGVAGTTTGAAPALPTGWVNTNDAVNTTSATGDGLPDGQQSVSLVTANVGTILFAIEQRPTANPSNATVVLNTNNPGGTTTYTVPATNFTASDPAPGAVTGLYFAAFPAGATTVTLGGTSYTSATFPAAGVTVGAAASGNPSQNIQIDPIDGAVTVALVYQAVDGAVINGVANTVRSLNSATVTVNFSDITLSGTVFQDANGGTINGTGIGSASGSQLYVHLLSNTGTAIAGSVPATVNADGTYALGTANGVRPSTTYRVVISTSNVNTTTTTTLPTGWVNTAEGTTAAGDGTPNGIVTTALTTLAANTAAGGAGVSGINFGIEQPPVVNWVTNIGVVNTPGYVALNPNLSATDPDGTVSSFTILTLPASGTLRYNGVNVIANQNILIGNLSLLTYQPTAGFSGNATFTYTATDNAGFVSTQSNNAGSITTSAATYTIPVGTADVATTITPSANPVNAGAALSFAVTYTNAGPNTAVGYTQTLTLTAGLGAGNVTFSNLPTGVTPAYNNGTGVVTFTGSPATLANGANQNLTVNIAAVPAGLASVSASTTVGTNTNQGADTGPNSATSTVTVTAIADVTTGISGPASVGAGQPTGNFTATFTNNGPSQAASVTQRVTLPVGSTLTAGQLSTIQTAYPAATYTAGTRVLDFGTAATLNSGSTNTFLFAYTAPSTTGSVSTVTNVGTGTSQGADVATNTASTATTITAVADVTTGISGPASIGAGQPTGNFTATFTNNGPSQAASVTQRVTLPVGSTLTAGQLSTIQTAYPAATYTAGTRVLDFGTAATLNSGSTNTFVFAYTAPTTTGSVNTVTNVGTGTSQGPDVATNTASTATTITAVADVTTAISGPASVGAGQPTGNFTATFTNNGPSQAASVTQRVTLPVGSTLTAGQLSTIQTAYPAATYNAGTRVLDFGTAATLNSGSTNTFVFAYTAPTTTGSVSTTTNVGTGTSQGADVATNTASTATTITAVADLTTAFTTAPTVVAPGAATGTYTVSFTNNGPSTSSSVTRTVTLPVGSSMTAPQITASGGSYNAGTRVLDFGTAATLASGASNSFNFTFTASATSGSVSVVSNVGSTITSQGPDTAPNSATAPLRINALPTANTVTNVTLPSNSAPVNLNAGLSGTDPDGTVVSFTILSLPTSGTLRYNGVAVTVNQNILIGNLALLTYQPVSGTTTTATFTYRAVDNDGGVSPAATYSIPFSPVADVLTTITANPTTVDAGSSLVLTVNFTNNGPNQAVPVTRQVTLPANLGVANVAVTNGGTYDNATGIVTYSSVATLNSGASQNSTITITRVPLTASIAVASVMGTTTGENGATANNNASLTVPVNNTAPTGCGISYSGSGSTSGLFAQYYLGYFEDTPNYQTAFFGNTPQFTRTEPTVNFPANNSWGDLVTSGAATGTVTDPNTYSTRFRGSIYIPTTGSYTFYTTSDDASAMFIDGAALAPTPGATGNALVKNYGRHGTTTVSATVTLSAGLHNVLLYFGEDGGGNVLTWEWESVAAGITRQIVPNSALCAGGAGLDLVTVISGPTAVTVGNSFTYTATTTNPTSLSTADATNVVQTIQLSPNLPAAAVSVTNGTYNATTGLVTFNPAATLALGATLTNTVTLDVTGLGITTVTGQAANTGSTTDLDLTNNNGTPAAANITTLISNGTTPPVASNVTNSPSMSHRANATAIAPLVATDADGTISTFTVLTLPTAAQGLLYVNGVELNATNFPGLVLTPTQATQLSFDPTGGPYGNFLFTYRATDNDGLNSTTVTYTIPVTDQAPVANADQNDAAYNVTTGGNVRLNDSDADGDVLTVSTTLVTAPTHGTVVMQANGSYTYTPVANYIGNDVFQYSICDNASPALCTTGTVNVRVYNPGTTCSSGTGVNLLANSDFNSGTAPASFGFSTQYAYVAAGGSLVPENTYTVTADPNPFHSAFSGSGHGAAAGDRYLAINASPDIQIMYTQTVSVQPNRYYTFTAYFQNMLVNRGLALPVVGFVINGASTSATVSIPERTSAANNWIRFSDIWYSGSNTTAIFEIRNLTTVRAGNDLGIDDVYFGTCNLPPTANADIRNTLPATPITFSITSNDTDGDGLIAPATVVLAGSAGATPGQWTDASGNTFSVNAAGNLTFTPAAGFVGTATATYTVQDNNGATSNPAQIAILVQAPTTDVATAITGPANNAVLVAGQTTTFTVVTSNNGPATAYNVSQTLQLPAGLPAATTLVNGQTGTLSGVIVTYPSGATYSTLTGLVTFPLLATQASGAGANVTNTVTFAAPGNGPVGATANVTQSGLDSAPANNTASVNVTVSPRFDLLTTISGPTTVVVGNLATFTVLTTNNTTSPSAGNNVVQTVQLPTGLVDVFVSNNGTYNSGTGVVTFPTINSLAPGQSLVNTITFDAPAAGFTASATVTPNTTGGGDTNTANNTASATATTIAPATVPRANVYTTIAPSATTAAPGGAVSLTIVTGNAGPDPASGVAQQVLLPPGLTFTVLNGGTYNAVTGILTFPTLASPLAAGSSQSYTVTFTAPSFGPVLAAAAVSSTTSDPVPSNNYMSTRIDITPRADVATTLTAAATVIAGQPLTYTVTTANLGGLPAQAVAQTVQIATGLTGVTVTGGGTYNATTGIVTFPAIATLPVGAAQSYAITFTAPADVTTLRATASVSSSTPDGVAANNAASVVTTIGSSADVIISIAGPTSAIYNSPVTYVVTTSNNGPSVAALITPTIQLPRNMVIVGLPTGAVYTAATGVLTLATLTDLPSGASSATAFTVLMPDVALLTPQAQAAVTAATNDRNLANNFGSTSTTILAPTDQSADLRATVAVTSSGSPVTTAAPNQSLTFTASFSNLGPDAATSAAPRLALPAGLNSATMTISDGGTYNATTGIVTWPVLTTPLDLTTPLVYTVTLPAPANGPLTATAVISSLTSDNTPANNVGATSVTINALTDVTTTVAGPTTALPGQAVTYTVTTLNNGPSTATTVQTTVTLPSGVTGVVLPTGATQAGNVVTLPADAVQVSGTNGQQTYEITFTAPNLASWSVTSAIVTATSESNGGNNNGSASTTRRNVAPVAYNVVNALAEPICETAEPRPISGLVGTDADGTVASFTILTLPPASQGVLYVEGVAFNTTNFPGLVLTVGQAALLSFDPAVGFAGNAFFPYTSTDNLGAISQPALYTLPLGFDTFSVYTTTPTKGVPGTNNPFANGDAIANVFDANGGKYVAAGATAQVDDTGTRQVVLAGGSNPLPAGTALNAVTGQITVTNRNLLVPGTYTVDITTVDVFGGTNTQPVTFTIGGAPLPVELIAFDAKARRQDALLTWATASERNAAYFAVERSLTGDRFTEIGRTDAHGTTSQRNDYAFTDRQIGQSVNGLVYYRLRQVDQDGTVTYAPVRTVRFSGKTEPVTVSFYPNPFTDAVTLDLTALPAGSPVTVTILDATGRLVRALTLTGAEVQSLDLHTLASGTYVVRLTGADGFTATQRLTKE